MTPVTDPAILAQLNGSQAPVANSAPSAADSATAAPAPTGLKPVTDPAILAQLNAAPSTMDKLANNPITTGINAAGGGLTLGITEGVQSLGALAKNILSSTIGKFTSPSVNAMANKVGEAVAAPIEAIRQGNLTNPVLADAAAQDPMIHAGAAGLGNVAASTAGLSEALGLAGKAVEAAAPEVAQAANSFSEVHPVLAGAGGQGLLGAGIGAAGNPQDPLSGAIVGGLTGGTLGGIGGRVGEALKTSGSIVERATQDIIDRGSNPMSLSSIRDIQGALKDEGLDLRIYDIKQQVKGEVESHLNDIRPTTFTPGDSPLAIIGNKLKSNYPGIKTENDANYAPLNADTTKFTPTNYNAVLENVKDTLPDINLPLKPNRITSPDTGAVTVSKISALPENPTINDMRAYSQQLAGTVKQAEAQALAGKISRNDVAPYYALKQAIDKDIKDSATTIPYTDPTDANIKTLGDQLDKANTFFKNNVQPFKVLDKKGNIINNPTVENKIWTNISAELQSRRPNFEKIRSNAAQLGPDGKELMGWGVLENAFNKSTTISGEFNPNGMQQKLTMMKASGLLNEVLTDQQQKVAQGISSTLEAFSKTKQKAPDVGYFASKVQMLTHSRLGIKLLEHIGASSSSAQSKRAMIQKLITGIGVQTVQPPQLSQ